MLVGIGASLIVLVVGWCVQWSFVSLRERRREGRARVKLTGTWYAWWQPRDRTTPKWYRDRLEIRRKRWNASGITFCNAPGDTQPQDGRRWDWAGEGTITAERDIVGSWKSNKTSARGAFVLSQFYNGFTGYLVGDNPTGAVMASPFVLLRFRPDGTPPTQSEIDEMLAQAKKSWPPFGTAV